MSEQSDFTPRVYLREPTERQGEAVAHWAVQTVDGAPPHIIDLDPLEVTQLIEGLSHALVRHTYLKSRQAKEPSS